MPFAGPQARAYLTPADELYYGGAAGGGKSQLVIGLSLTQHRNTLFLRRLQTDTKAISEAYRDLPARWGRWRASGYGGDFRTADGRLVEVGGCQVEDDWKKYAGHAHDLKAFDELPQFSEKQYTTLVAWNRVRDPLKFPRQRCRAVGAGNPPTDPAGEWVLRRWGPWLDPSHADKARPGELRWYLRLDGEDDERPVPSADPITWKGRTYRPRSRTFIPARVEDNPAYMAQGYADTLNALPEPLRSMLRYGDMAAARQDDRWQLIPTRWVVLAQRRWAERGGATGPLDCLGVDVAMSTTDAGDWTVLAPRHGATVGNLVKRKGKDTPDGQSVVALVMAAGGGAGVAVHYDAVGIGKSAVDAHRMMGLSGERAVQAAGATDWTDPTFPALRFANVRSASLWHVRSLLDPEGGPEETRLALPPDPDLLADLTAPRYALRVTGVAAESKEDVRKRIGRSPDAGDAVALACWLDATAGPGMYDDALKWRPERRDW